MTSIIHGGTMNHFITPHHDQPEQFSLFDIPIKSIIHPRSADSTLSIQERFERFHKANPHIYKLLLDMSLSMRKYGVRKYGMKGLFEILRWRYALQTRGGDGFKLNNDFTPYYARKLMDENPELEGFFETRICRG